MNYIAYVKDPKLISYLDSIRKGDKLSIFYNDGDETVSIPFCTALTTFKGEYEFIKISNDNSMLNIAFYIGQMYAKSNGNIEILSSGEELDSIKSYIAESVPTKPRKARAQNTSSAAKNSEQPKLNDSEERPKNPKKIPTEKKYEVKNEASSDQSFDKMFEELMNLLKSCSNKTFSPDKYLQPIVSAFKDGAKEDMSFEEALRIRVNSITAERIVTTIKPKYEEIKKLAMAIED